MSSDGQKKHPPGGSVDSGKRGFLFRWGAKKPPPPAIPKKTAVRGILKKESPPAATAKATTDAKSQKAALVIDPKGATATATMTPSSANRKDATSASSKTDSTPIISNRQADKKNNTIKKPVGAFLCRSKFFRQACDHAFEMIDTDNSGTVDEKGAFAANLLLFTRRHSKGLHNSKLTKPWSPFRTIFRLAADSFETGNVCWTCRLSTAGTRTLQCSLSPDGCRSNGNFGSS